MLGRFVLIDTEGNITNIVSWDPETDPDWSPGDDVKVVLIADDVVQPPGGKAARSLIDAAVSAVAVAVAAERVTKP